MLLCISVVGRAANVEDQPEGHATRRFGLRAGHDNRTGGLIEGSLRLALHDLLDPAEGYPPGSQIEFMNLRGRYNWDESRSELTEATLFRITSLAPLSPFEDSLSWRIQLGARRLTDRNCDRCLAGSFELGLGPVVQLGPVLPFLLGELEATASPALHASKLRFGAGPRTGILVKFTDAFNATVDVGYRYLVFSAKPHVVDATLGLRLGLSHALSLDVQGRTSSNDWDVLSGLYFYF